MSRKRTIHKDEGDTQWGVQVEDSYGTEHHLGYLSDLTIDELKFLNYPTDGFTSKNIIEQATDIWENEVVFDGKDEERPYIYERNPDTGEIFRRRAMDYNNRECINPAVNSVPNI